MLSLVRPSTPTIVRQFFGRVGGPVFFIVDVLSEGVTAATKLPLLPPPPTTEEHAEEDEEEEEEEAELGNRPPPFGEA